MQILRFREIEIAKCKCVFEFAKKLAENSPKMTAQNLRRYLHEIGDKYDL